MKIVYITPHLSTGGMPEYLRKKVELLHKDNEIWVFEMVYEKQYTTIREKIEGMIGSRLVSLNQNYKKLFTQLQKISPDIIHFEETSDHFLPHSLLDKIYSPTRTWKIFETLHDSSIDHREKKYLPDKMLVVSLWQVKNFLPLGIPIEIIEHEITPGERNRELGMKTLGLDPEKKHVLQVGLFSNRKNQRFTFSLARLMPDVQFHFVGALPDNYRDHWQDLVDNKPPNCVIWKERSDVHTFYSCMDAVIFPSEGRYGDTETNPLAIKEAIVWDIPLFLRNIPVYMNGYQESSKLKWMAQDLEENSKILYSMLNLINNYTLIKPEFFYQKLFDIDFDSSDNKLTLNYLHDLPFDMMVCIRDMDTQIPIFSFDAKFENKNNYWAIPLPKSYYDFSENPNFSGFLIDFYDHGKNLLYSQSYQIKMINLQKKRFRIDTYEPIFVNFEQFFTDKIYDQFLSNIDSLDLVLDVGSSIGLFTELAKDKGAKKVIAFEVSDKAVEVFNNLHGVDSRVSLVKNAVWNKREVIKIYENQNNSIINSAIKITDKHFEISSIDLDSFFNDSGIEKVSLMKMDIEGSEYKAFEGLSDQNLLKIENIILEFHDNFEDILRNQIILRIIKLGYQYQIFEEDCKTPINGTSQEKGVVFISKNINQDKQFTKTDTQIKGLEKTLVILDSYVSSRRVKERLIQQIERFKNRGFDLMLVSNTTIDREIQQMVDFFYYDRRNQLFREEYSNVREIIINDYVSLESKWIFTLKNFTKGVQKHGLSVMVNFHNAMSLAKSLGYTNVVRIECDDLYGNRSLDKIYEIALELESSDQKGVLFLNDYDESVESEENNISFHLQFWNIDYFLDTIPKFSKESDYLEFIQKKWHSKDFVTVEVLFRRLLEKTNLKELKIHNGRIMDNILIDTIWNTEASISNFSNNFKDFFTGVYRVENSDNFMFFSRNLTNNTIGIKFILVYDDDREEILEQELANYESSWCWNIVDSSLISWQVVYQNRIVFSGKSKDLRDTVQLPNT